MWCASEYRFMKMYLSHSIGFYYNVQSREIFIPRQDRWKVSMFEHETVYDLHNENNVGKTAKCSRPKVRALFMRSTQARMKDRNVLIHVHGGGFISQSPETHSYYLADWVHNLKGIPFLLMIHFI